MRKDTLFLVLMLLGYLGLFASLATGNVGAAAVFCASALGFFGLREWELS